MTTPNSEFTRQLPILEHLGELSKHITRGLIGLVVGTIVGFVVGGWLFEYITDCANIPSVAADFANNVLNLPLETQEINCQIQAIQPTETIGIYFRIALTFGTVLAMPWMLLQLWSFISPGLHKHEKRYVFFFVPAATILFLSGVAFAWAILLSPALLFLDSFLAENVSIEWTAESFVNFVTGFLFWLGVAFQMPLIVYFLGRLGFISESFLKENWRFAIVGIAILAAFITPSADPVTMLLTMAPLLLLYVASIFTSRLGYRQFMAVGVPTEETE